MQKFQGFLCIIAIGISIAVTGCSSDKIIGSTTAKSNSTAITGFFLNGSSGTITGTTIAVAVPSEISLNHLVATFTTTGASVTVNGIAQTSGITPNDFTNSVAYIVTAEDGTLATYTVTATNSSFTGNFLSWTGASDTSHYFTLVKVNGTTGSVTNIGGTDFFTGLAYGNDGKLYGVSDKLVIINPATGATTKVGDLLYLGSAILMQEMAFSPTGELFVLENETPCRGFTVNLSTGALSYVGTLASSINANGLEFSAMGTLYTSFNNLFTLDPSTMITTANLGSTGGVFISKLTFGNGGTLYGMDIFSSTYIYYLDLYSGIATVRTAVGSIGLASLVAEQSSTTPLTSALVKVEKELAASSPDIESLIKMENKIKARHLMLKQ